MVGAMKKNVILLLFLHCCRGQRLSRAVFPEVSPEVCVCVLSWNRLDLLRRTLTSAVGLLETLSVSYEIVWVDNGSNNHTELTQILLDFPIEKRLLLSSNYGISYGLNTLFFDLCRAPFILTLEEDWVVKPTERLPTTVVQAAAATESGDQIAQIDPIRSAIRIIRGNRRLVGVILRAENANWEHAPTTSSWRRSEGAEGQGLPECVRVKSA